MIRYFGLVPTLPSSARCQHFFRFESGSPRVPYLRGLLLLTSSTASYPAVAGLRLVGYTRLRRCEFTDRLLQHCSCWCTKDSHGQATACVERGCARPHRHYKFDRGLSQILHDELHWLDVPDRVFKLAVTGICLLDTIAFMALEVVDDYCAI